MATFLGGIVLGSILLAIALFPAPCRAGLVAAPDCGLHRLGLPRETQMMDALSLLLLGIGLAVPLLEGFGRGMFWVTSLDL